MKMKNLLERALLGASKNQHNEKVADLPAELKVSEPFSLSVPDYSGINTPYVFFLNDVQRTAFPPPAFHVLVRSTGEKPRFHRKQWEFVYICQSLYERGYLRKGV